MTKEQKQEILRLLGQLAEAVSDAQSQPNLEHLDLQFVSIVDQISVIEEKVEAFEVTYGPCNG